MYTDTEGIILRQTKIVGGRRMLVLFSKKYGKISAGSFINEKGRSKSALAMRPFTHGRYELYKKGSYFNINGAETIESYYRIGEDVDKYMNASYCLELVDKLLEEGEPAPGLFNLTCDLLAEMEKRRGRYLTLVLAFEVKALRQIGYLPELDRCVSCGKEKEAAAFNVPGGGIMCADCAKYTKNTNRDLLIYDIDFGIVNVLKYFLGHPLESLEKLALKEENISLIRTILREYLRYHLGIEELKSENLI
ncbi:MAG: DNA repair protein RecO [Anaerovoracaceae bacterium]|jgi:DNA repair protein RecO (recombination protein O)